MKRNTGWLTSGGFAALCGATKETLRHYKDIGLLVPAHQGENGYFYYDMEQFYDFYAISIFRQTGTPLDEVRCCLRGQHVPETLALLQAQRERLERERDKLDQMDFALSGMIRNLRLGASPDMVPKTAWFEREHLLALPAEELERELDLSAGDDALLIAVLERCGALCRQYGLRTDYQLGAIHRPGERAEQATITHLYTRVKEKTGFPFYLEKPAGNYLYLCCRGRWDISEGYAALCRHIAERHLPAEGNFYACDLAGFILNGVEENAATMISVRLAD
nr:MerR family transcriptional regulator [uncultured Oscillibacter sp.]